MLRIARHKARKEAIRRAPFCALCGKFARLEVHTHPSFWLTRDNSQANLVPVCKKQHKVIEKIVHDLEGADLGLANGGALVAQRATPRSDSDPFRPEATA